MCGICGVAKRSGIAAGDELAVRRMNDALVHRGPDSAGSIVRGDVCLAMRRLSIIDLAGGSQPISNEDKTVHVVQNGEIYNHLELREELVRAGHTFATQSDTEAIVHLYEQEGPGFAGRLRGMFAIAIWDERLQTLTLARDRYGIKPLYYRHDSSGRLAFASELKALLTEDGISKEIDPEALQAFLAFNWIPAPRSIFKSAAKLEPGHLLTWREGRLEIARYATVEPTDEADLEDATESELAEELLSRLSGSVRAHLIADVPVGTMLSGGIDSCLLTALAAEHSSKPVSTFTIGFEERSFSEADLARVVAERYGTDHHELIVRPDAAELMPKLAEAFDEPFADSSALPTYIVTELASESVKVAFSGEGGDELFAGYNTYSADLLAPRVGRLASIARPLIERLPNSNGSLRIEDKLKRFARAAQLEPLERHLRWSEVFSPELRASVAPEVAAGDPYAECRAAFAESTGSELLTRLQAVDLRVLLPSDQLAKTDRTSMAHSLEVRVPFLDPSIVEFAFSTPVSAKIRGRKKKRVLRAAAEAKLPPEILNARKRGFSIPAAAWLRGELRPFMDEVLAPQRIRSQGYFDPTVVSSLVERHAAGREDLSRHLWGLMTFSLWHDRYG